jgi:hypothetical protein
MSSKTSKKKTKLDRMIMDLESGKTFTAKEAVRRYGYSSQGSFSGSVTTLRNEGYNIVCLTKGGGRPSRGRPGRYELIT